MRAAPLVGFIALFSVPLVGQSVPATKFEVADVRVSVPAENVPPALNTAVRIGVPRNGLYEIRRATMLDLVRTAYAVEADKVLGGPHWLEMNRFDIVAKVPPSATRETVTPSTFSVLSEATPFSTANTAEPSSTGATGLADAVSSWAGTEVSRRRRSV